MKLLTSSEINAELVGSWSVIVGDQDQTFHVWKYIGGYSEIDKAREVLGKDPVSSFGYSFRDTYVPITFILVGRNIASSGRNKVLLSGPDMCNMY